MLDFSHIPQGSTAVQAQWFYATGVWTPYELPRGCSQVFMLGIGGGGGGGGGLSGASGTNRGGGSGGSSGAMTRCLFRRSEFARSDLCTGRIKCRHGRRAGYRWYQWWRDLCRGAAKHDGALSLFARQWRWQGSGRHHGIGSGRRGECRYHGGEL